MINEIIYNPYRVLGVYSNSSKKEQIANKGKLQAFLKVGKNMSFPLDLTPLLPQLNRTEEMVQEAESQLTLPKDQVKHALFWFIKKTPIDEIAFNHLITGNIVKAKDIWSKVTNMSSLQNLFVLEMIRACSTDSNQPGQQTNEMSRQVDMGIVADAINKYLIPIYNEYINEFVSCITDNYKLSKAEFISIIVDAIEANGLHVDHHIIDSKEWTDTIVSKKKNTLVDELEGHINDAIAQKKKKDPAEALNAGQRLAAASEVCLENLSLTLGKNDTQYELMADKVAMTIIDCMVAYYNNTKDDDRPVKAMPLCEFAVKIAKGLSAKNRAKENLDTVKEAYDNMPPTSVVQHKKQIDRIFAWYREQKATAANGLELIKRAKSSIISIKETLGKDHSYYRKISTEIANAALSYVIDEVNDIVGELNDNEKSLNSRYGINAPLYRQLETYGIFKEQRRKDLIQALGNALKDAWETILLLDLFDTTDDFKNKRFLPNRSSLRSIIQSAKGFEMPNGTLYSTVGCCYWVKVDPDFLATESELYSRCKDIDSYKNYIAHYPSGKHAEEIRLKIKAVEKRKKHINYAIYAFVAVCIVLIIIAAVMNKSSNGEYSEQLYDTTAVVEEVPQEQIGTEYDDSYSYPEEEESNSYPEEDNTYSYSEEDEMTDEERYLAQFNNFEPSSSDVQGGVVYEGSGDYYIVETNRGYVIAERYSGMLYEGQTIYGRLNSYGMKYFINLSRDSEVKLYIEDYMLSQDQAVEWMGNHRHLKYTDQSRYDQSNNDW